MRAFLRLAPYLAFTWVLIAPGVVRSEPVLGDGDQDFDRDLADVAQLLNCHGLANEPGHPECDAFEFLPNGEFNAMSFALFSCGFGGPGIAIQAIFADSPPSPTANLSAHLSGVTAGATSVRITGGAQTVNVPTDGCAFETDVQLTPNVVNHLFLTAVFGDDNLSAAFPINVSHDAQPPSLFVDFPAANSEIVAATTDVAGRVGDPLSGFAGMTVEAAVNDLPPVPAVVDIGVGTNGTYFLRQLPLSLGVNTIRVTARDALGNAIEKQISVSRLEAPANAAQLVVLSGDAQSAPVRGVLPLPMQVKVSSAKGIPLAGKVVTFKVTRSDGRIAQNSSGLFPGAKMIQVFTDSQGIARAFWRVGGDAGRGNNRVEVTSESVVGTTSFCASATPGPATQINVSGGNNQRAAVGSQAPEKLGVWVNDSCNPLAGIEVTFRVLQGGGKVDGLDEVTIETTPSGHAEAGLMLGIIAGNNVVEASFPGNPNPPAIFSITGIGRDEDIPTSFTGLVLDNGGQPIQGATCALIIGGSTLPFVSSDLNGQFRFDDISGSGPADLHVFGASATHVGGANGIDIPMNTFPALRYNTTIVPNAVNSLPTPVLLPRLDPANARNYSTTQDTELTVAGMAGLKMIIKAGSMKIRIGGQLLPAPNGTVVSLNQVHHDDVPMPLPDGAAPPFAWTLQPGGAQFDPPVTIFYPNMSGLPAGAIANFLSFNHGTGRFEIIASGHVSDDGTTIISDPGSGITIAGWGCNCPPYSVTGQCCHCNQCQVCQNGLCFPAGIPCGESCCQDGQTCCNGSCIAAGSICCDEGNVCSSDETCCQGSCCLQGEECCESGCCRADEQCCGDRCISALNICCDNGIECFPEFPMCCGQGCCVADGICCDDECQIPGSNCCLAGKVCSPPTPRCCGDNCCAENAECCNGVCTAPGGHCCDDANFCSGDTPQCCVETCCAADAVCCDGTCGPPGAVCCEGSGFCPAESPQCCDNTCCKSDEVCCNGSCHPAGTVCCTDGNLCSGDTPTCCGESCCAAGEVCCDGECAAAGSVCCEGRTCPGDAPLCCGDKNCCPADATCCGESGSCCAPDTTCCGPAACCGVDEFCCNEECHPAPGTCCEDGSVCSGLGAVCCSNGCFPEGSVCCPEGRGCPGESPQCCGQENCCPADAQCCGESGLCCAPEATCCGAAACCDVDEFCCNDSCHPAPGTCCDDGTVCSGLGAVCCSGGCFPEGSVCCPEGRGCPADNPQCCGQENCCPADAQCCGESGLCCPPQAACCGASCCDIDEFCCNDSCHPAPGTCCEDGTACSGLDAICCNGNCCDKGQVCCDGTCTPENQCCSDGRPFCGDVCCNTGAVCCGGTCVPETQCCSDGRPFCGDVCCNTGAVCCGGTCVPEIQCCSDGRPFCGDVCCNSSSACCDGACAPIGQPCP